MVAPAGYRDTNGDIISMRRENGQTSYYEYDVVRRLTKETIVDSTMAVMYAYEYDFDAAGNRTYLKLTAGDSTEIYYEYDAANAITRRHTLADGFGRTAGWAYYEYNANGSLTSFKAENGDETTYTWDENQLCEAIVPPAGQPTYFYYDGRLTRYAMGGVGNQARPTYFSWDGINILQTETLNAARTHQVSLTHGATPIAGIGSVVEQQRTGFEPSTRYLHTDHRGTTYKITDDTGAETWSGLTDAYGVELGETGTPDQSIFWYQGQAWYRHEVGGQVLYVSPTRIYMPEDGRFLERDPIEKIGGMNYGYMSPNAVDPDGRNPIAAAAALALGAVALAYICLDRKKGKAKKGSYYHEVDKIINDLNLPPTKPPEDGGDGGGEKAHCCEFRCERDAYWYRATSSGLKAFRSVVDLGRWGEEYLATTPQLSVCHGMLNAQQTRLARWISRGLRHLSQSRGMGRWTAPQLGVILVSGTVLKDVLPETLWRPQLPIADDSDGSDAVRLPLDYPTMQRRVRCSVVATQEGNCPSTFSEFTNITPESVRPRQAFPPVPASLEE